MPAPARRRFALAALALAVALAPLVFAQEEGRRYALLIGVKGYAKDQFRPLKYTENDVNALAAVFKDAGFKRVVLMTQAAAADDVRLMPTARRIREQLRSLLEDRTKADTVVVAFSGHGVQFAKDKGHYFCPTDADLTDRDTLVSLKDVYEELKGCEARVKVLLVDACRNDPLAEGSTRSLEKVKLESKTRPQQEKVPAGVAALFSCGEGQESYESDKLKHGVFFHHVIQGLKGKGGVNLLALAGHVAAEVPDWVKEEFGPKARQRPTLRDEHEVSGAVVLVPPGKEVVTKVEKEWTNAVGMRLVKIPGGTFTMGSPADENERFKDEAQHEVEVSELYLGANEVTQGQFREVMGYNPSYFSKTAKGKAGVEYSGKPGSGGDRLEAGEEGDKYPVENVSWQEAKEFCEKLNEKTDRKRPGGWAYRLPTEAEWEYSCRGGASTYSTFHFGNLLNDSTSKSQANFDGNYPYGSTEKSEYRRRPREVGYYRSNAFGLHDMHGNVREWCADWYDKDYYASSPKRDPAGPSGGSARVLRGGGWDSLGRSCRSAYRGRHSPGDRRNLIGFRVALVPSGRAGMPE